MIKSDMDKLVFIYKYLIWKDLRGILLRVMVTCHGYFNYLQCFCTLQTALQTVLPPIVLYKETVSISLFFLRQDQVLVKMNQSLSEVTQQVERLAKLRSTIQSLSTWYVYKSAMLSLSSWYVFNSAIQSLSSWSVYRSSYYTVIVDMICI